MIGVDVQELPYSYTVVVVVRTVVESNHAETYAASSDSVTKQQ
jgi:hypothetical protein